MAELQGRVLKNYNGYYYLKVEGESEPYTCKVKGKMKKNRFSLATGDIACFEVSSRRKARGDDYRCAAAQKFSAASYAG